MSDQIIYYEKYIRLPVTVAPCCRCRCRCNCQRWSESTVANIHVRGRIIFRSRSRENAPKSVSAEDLQPCHDPQRSISTVRSVGMLRRVRLRAMSGRNFQNVYAAAEIFVRNRARTRRNPCLPKICSLATTLRGPSALRGASVCCGA